MARRQGGSAGAQRFLATVLFTDIVGSTERAVQLGDRAWRDLLERHHAVVREQLRRFGGREIDTAGDSFFAAFALPAQAIACAKASVDAVRALGIDIRAGLHMGECEVHGEKVGGIAVHIGARVAHMANAREVLVTGTLRELVHGSGIEFEDRGTAELKGVPGTWHVFAVTDASAVEPAPAEADRGRRALDRLPLPPAGGRSSPARRRRLQLLGAALAVAAVASGVGVFLLTRSGTTETVTAIQANALGRIDASTGRLIGQVEVGSRPAAVTFGAGSVWVTNESDGTVSRVGPKDMHVEQTIEVGSDPNAIAYGAGSVWVANSEDGTVSRISPDVNRVVGDPIDVGVAPSAVTVGGGAVWVANTGSASVTRIDPSGTDPPQEFDGPDRPSGLVFADGSLWISSGTSASVSRMNPDGTLQPPIHVGNGADALAVAGGAVWVANDLDETVSRIDPTTNSVTATIPVPPGPDGLAGSANTLWVSSRFGEVVSEIDARSTGADITRTVDVHTSARGVVLAGGDVWLAGAGSTRGGHRGGTLRVAQYATISSIDPATSYEVLGWDILSMTNDGLDTFERVEGSEGATLVPDLAVALPIPSDGGRTYSFELRPDIAYSTGRPVRASDLRFALERAFKLHVPRPDFYSGIVGGAACAAHPNTCDLSKGIVTNDARGTVTFHLTAPDPEFLYKLALPFAMAVPQGTPIAETRKGLPATGPYMVVDYRKDGRVVLTRNPRFEEWSAAAQPDGYPDRIVIDQKGPVSRETDQVLNGDLDLMLDDPPADRLESIQVEHPSQLHGYVLDATAYFFLNTHIPPFDSLDARRALNFAADRRHLGNPFGRQFSVSCQVLPPTVPGYRPYCPYTANPTPSGTWTGPDLATARRLVKRSGTAGTHVTVLSGQFSLSASREIAATLRSIGYPTSIRRVSDDEYFKKVSLDHTIQIGTNGWVGDYPAASVFLDGLLSCSAYRPDSPANINYGGFCDHRLDRAVHQAERLTLTDPGAAVRKWAEADRIATDAAAWVAFSNPRGFDFASPDLGGYARHPVWGVLLDQVWIR